MSYDGVSSRIIIKNLPKHINEIRLKTIFGEKGEITDVRLMKNHEGVFRKFAFIGYRTEAEAKSAVHYFDNTYIDTSRVSVQLSKPYGDPSLPRPWSKYSKGSSAYGEKIKEDRNYTRECDIVANGTNDSRNITNSQTPKWKDSSISEDPKFQEFLQLMAPSTRSNLWANEDGHWSSRQQKKSTSKHLKFDDYGEAIPETSLGDRMSQDETYSRSVDTSNYEDEEKNQSNSNSLTEPIMSLDDFESHKSLSTNPSTKKGSFDTPSANEELSPEEMLLETGRLFVRNLSYLCTEEDLQKLFGPFGPLSEIHMPISKETHQPKGFAYVLYMIPEHAMKAYAELDGKIFQGRLLHLVASAPKT